MADQMSGRLGRAAIIWFAATLLMLPAFAVGHIISDNSFLNVNWSEGFSQQLFAGHIYPRWLPAMNAGAGSPVFYFYAPLPFYLTAPFHLIVGPRFAVLLGMWLMLGLSGQAFHALAANFVRGSAALFASLAYMAMPYHLLVDAWLRSDFGELSAYIFIPLCLLSTFRLASRPIWTFALAASLAGLLLSHLPSALLFAPFLVAFCLYVAAQNGLQSVLVRAATAAALGLGLAAAYIVPALGLQSLVHVDNWAKFRPANSLLFSGPTSALGILLDAIVANAMLVIAAFVIGMKVNGQWRQIVPWAAFAATVVFLVSPISIIVWNNLPAIFDRIQFAWRILLLLDISFCMLLAITLETRIWSSGIVVRVTVFGLVAVLALFLTFRSREGISGFFRLTPNQEENLIAAHAEPLEYLPSCRPIRTSDLSDGYSDGVTRNAFAEKTSDELAIFYYPFLAVRVNGKIVPTRCDSKTGFISIGRHAGVVEVEVRAGGAETIGKALSLSSVVILLLGMTYSTRPRWTRFRRSAETKK